MSTQWTLGQLIDALERAERPEDWSRIVPGLYTPTIVSPASVHFETAQREWRFAIGESQARLHVALRHGRTKSPSDVEVLVLQFVVRGPPVPPSLEGVIRGFELGHRTIVDSFVAMTSDMAKRHWRWKGFSR